MGSGNDPDSAPRAWSPEPRPLTSEETRVIVREAEDNWKHRSTKMKCGGCMWFSPKKGALGRCRRHAPTLNGWPAIFETDWCGDHKLDEEKIR